ncbi:M48 family metallopeptidase [Neisseria sp. S1]|uniref:M48 family metallopeptidase n=1 Tax=Neisseria sp. S1 TaxID=3318354 RepID=UPI003A863D41
MQISHTLSDGLSICLHIVRRAKKNIILRPMHGNQISLSIPPKLNEKQLRYWLQTNEKVLRNILKRNLAETPSENNIPQKIWYRGISHDVRSHNKPYIEIAENHIFLPEKEQEQQKAHLLRFLRTQAENILLSRLQTHAEQLELFPAAIALSNAKTFWGVCRPQSGIRLNYRLIGAPDFVIDYVCIHELCHLIHPNHSKQFWAAVNLYTPHTINAKTWLKQHGKELFILE